MVYQNQQKRYNSLMIRIFVPLITALFLLFFLLLGSNSEKKLQITEPNCTSCHDMQLDPAHDIGCTTCHQGSMTSTEKALAHEGLIAKPAHPDHMKTSCGQCHTQQVEGIRHSLHYTLTNSTNTFRELFRAKRALTSFTDTPRVIDPQNITELADDLLRRRCFRCHLFSEGDKYPATSRGTGCSACHLSITEGNLKSHLFSKPNDKQCLSCHYGNYVGYDYYGRFEHDFNNEYRTPYTTEKTFTRPYGVEYHQLSPDIHQQRALSCIDCHSNKELMTDRGTVPSCKGCHKKHMIQSQPMEKIVAEISGEFSFIATDGTKHPLPLMEHPAHNNHSTGREKIACQSCHAQWSFNDSGKHFLRSDTDNYDAFEFLSVQGSREIESIIENNNDFDKDELPLLMTDKLTGQTSKGIWHKGFTQRRWEKVQLGRDTDGVITPVRPQFDYALSWIDDEDIVRFDSVRPFLNGDHMQAYVPHTTGSAGLFYASRIRQFLKAERKQEKSGISQNPISK